MRWWVLFGLLAPGLALGDDAWYAQIEEGRVCHRPYGFCAELPEDWQVQLLGAGTDVAGLLLVPPAYPTSQGRVNASILLLAAPAGDRPLEDFLYDGVKKRRRGAPIEAAGIEGAVAIEVRDPRTYRRIGGAHAVKIAFARQRASGPVQYSVLLDIGELAYEPARADFDRFVAGISVEGP